MKEPEHHPPERRPHLGRAIRQSLWLLLLLLILTQYPLLSLFNDGTPLVFGFPVLFCYLTGVFLIFFVLFILLIRDKE
jgi:hypothetical protein